MYNHNKAQQSKNRVHISWDILYLRIKSYSMFLFCLFMCPDQDNRDLTFVYLHIQSSVVITRSNIALYYIQHFNYWDINYISTYKNTSHSSPVMGSFFVRIFEKIDGVTTASHLIPVHKLVMWPCRYDHGRWIRTAHLPVLFTVKLNGYGSMMSSYIPGKTTTVPLLLTWINFKPIMDK